MNKRILCISLLLMFIDQISKTIIQLFDIGLEIIPGFFSIVYYQNTGAAWSIFAGKQPLLIIVGIIVIGLVYNMTFSYKESKCTNLAFGLLLGGIAGNIIDRIFYNYVRDFIYIKIIKYDFPVFNIADMAIVIGVILLVIITLKGEIKNGNKGFRKGTKNR